MSDLMSKCTALKAEKAFKQWANEHCELKLVLNRKAKRVYLLFVVSIRDYAMYQQPR